MRTRILYFLIVMVLVLGIAGGVYWHMTRPDPLALAAKRLAACGALPTNDIFDVPETSRIFINLPKDLYPNKQLETDPHGATAGYISNGGPYGDALEARGKPNCWSYYLEFDLTPDNKNTTGTVDIVSRSGMPGVPDYVLHARVTRR